MSGVLRPWLLKLANAGLYQPLWSERIGREWRRNAERIWSIEANVLDDEWQAMQHGFTDANVSLWPSASEVNMPTLKYSDAKDWHVIEAAWQAKQTYPDRHCGIVTFNIKDFSRSELRRLGLDLWEPDRLLSDWHRSHATLIQTTLDGVISELVASGRRHAAPIEVFLKRERLFRLNKKLTAQRP